MSFLLLRGYFITKGAFGTTYISNQNEYKMKLALKYFSRANSHGIQLAMVTKYGFANVIQFLLDDGANVNAQSAFDGNALYETTGQGHPDIVRLLVERGANVNAQTGQYGNAVGAARFYGYSGLSNIWWDKGRV
jgi:ankyrin repeat protein